MVLDDKGRLYSFGTGTAGCLGHGDCLKQNFPVMIQEFAQNDISIINFSAGVDISMAVSSDGNVYSWGKTDGGRIGLGDAKTSVSIPRRVALPGDGSVKAVDVDCAYVHSLIVGLDGSVYQCGGVGVDGADDGQSGARLERGELIREALAHRVDVVRPLVHSSQPLLSRPQRGNGLLFRVVTPDVIPLAV